MFKFVHIADTHLDSAVKSSAENQQLVFDEMIKAFEAAVNLCINENCNAMLIAGDLFDDKKLSFKTELMIRENFQRLNRKHISVYYCLGNHDPKSSEIHRFKLGDNVHIFENEEPVSYEVKDIDNNLVGIVTGVGYSSRHTNKNLSKNFKEPKNKNVPNVAIMHTSLDIGAEKVYAPCTYNDLKESFYDYWALGHIHKREVYDEGVPAIFPGCTCGRDFGETGPKGAYLVTLDNKSVRYEFIDLAGIEWHDIEADGFDKAEDAGDMLDRCVDIVNSAVIHNKKNVLRITLKGQCPIYREITDDNRIYLQDKIRRETGVYITLINKLTSFINPDDYIYDKHLLSVALNTADEMKNDKELKSFILEIAEKEYKGLDGGDDDEYIGLLLKNIKRRLCDIMIKQDSNQV